LVGKGGLMTDIKIFIGSKEVLLSMPYKATEIEFIGMEEEMNLIFASWIRGEKSPPLSPLLVGESGVGKSEIVYECAKIWKKDLYTMQGNEDLSAEDLICQVRISDDPNKKIDYILSPLGTAMIKGGIFFLDGIDKMRHKALALLEGLLDRRQYIDSVMLGERIFAQAEFRFVAAANQITKDELPNWILTRMKPVIYFPYPNKKQIKKIIYSRFKDKSLNIENLIDFFWNIWGKKYNSKPLTPREALNIFSLAQNLADFELKKSSKAKSVGNNGVINKKHLELAINCISERSE